MSEARPPGDWTLGSLYAHFTAVHEEFDKRLSQIIGDLQGQLDRRIEVQERERKDTERHLIALIEALNRAVDKAEINVTHRLESLNKLREAVEADRSQFMTRQEISTEIKAMETRIEQLREDSVRRIGGEELLDRRRSQFQPWMIWAAGAVLTIVIVAVNVVVAVGS